MLVKDLIKELKKFPEDMEVFLENPDTDEYTHASVGSVFSVKIDMHSDPEDEDSPKEEVEFVVID